jgi:hypothetical protein
MGVKLTEIYEEAQKEFGAMGRMKMAMLTLLSSSKAANAPDSPENIKLFRDALVKLRENKAA